MFVKDPFHTLARVFTLENPQQFRVGFKPSYVRVRCVRVGVGVGHFQPLPYPWCTLLGTRTKHFPVSRTGQHIAQEV